MGGQIFPGRGDGEPIGSAFKRGEKTLHPATVRVTVIVGSRPGAEFFAIVARGGHAARISGSGVSQEAEGVFRRAKREQVPQGFEAGKDANGVPAVFRDVIAVKLVKFKTSGQEVHVVDDGVLDARGGQNAGQLRFPDTLGQPGSRRGRTELFC